MQINATNYLKPVHATDRRAAAPATAAQDAAIFTDIAALSARLSATPDVRPEAVALARSLIAQSSYPPEATIRGIANLLALNIRSENE
ncbi:MAG TPA: hypothetical protein VK530_04080 [Candidatus Acidoferrum sp.]|nr:hypothetical protein [Candidatus Acidoferrum sp.]